MNPRQHHLVFPHGVWQQCRELLFRADGGECFLMGLARPCQRGDDVTAHVVEQLVDPLDVGYDHRSSGGLTLDLKASNRMNHLAINASAVGLVPVHLHSHPRGVDDFSSYDDHHEQKLHDWLREQGQAALWSLVWPYHGQPVARIWLHGRPEIGVVREGLRPFTDDPWADVEALARQRAFGMGLRHAAGVLRVGIVGIGGIGLPVAEQLARSGFAHFVLIDHDNVECTNLNRMPGTRRKDIGRPKVLVARRTILRAARCLGIEPWIRTRVHNVYNAPERTRDLLRNCDLILALTDDEASRVSCLQLALEGGGEYLQAGVDVRLDEVGAITGLFFEVTGAEVSRYCPLCTGRLNAGQASVDARRYAGGEVWEHALAHGYISDVPAPSVMSLNAMAAGALVLEIQRRVAGLGVRDYLRVDMMTGETVSYEHIQDRLTGECGVCGRGEGKAHAQQTPKKSVMFP